MISDLTNKKLEMLKDLYLAAKQGIAGISVRRGEKRLYATLERDGLVCFVNGFGRDGHSIRLTDQGREYAAFNFAYAYRDLPHRGQTTYQDQHGKVSLVC